MGIATSPYVCACPVNVQIVQIECQTNQLVLDFTVKQFMIHGECNDIENFKRLCTDQVEEIIMQRNGKTFDFSGVYFANK